MKIGLYIAELLLEHDSVSLPGLGVFSIQTRPSRFSADGLVLQPPSRQILFIPEVRINDGLLLHHIAYRHGITAPRAFIELNGICDEIHYRLDHGELITLEGLGKLGKKEGVYFFEMLPESSAHPDFFGFEPVNPISFKEKEQRVPLTKDTSAGQGKPSGKRKWFRWVAMLSAIVFITILMLVIPNKKDDQGELPFEKYMEEKEQATALHSESYPDTGDTLSTPGTEPNPATDRAAVVPHPVKGLYYLVGGSFRTRENAEQFFTKMAGRGFEPVHLGEIGRFHVVAISVFTDMGEAARAQSEMLHKDSLSGVWVYYLPEKE